MLERRLLLVAATVVLAAACGDSTGPAGPNAVAVRNNQFAPAALTVAPATTVSWNFQEGTHDVTFEDGAGNSARNQSSGTHTRNFGAAGTFRYRCTLHSADFTSGMVGVVTVQ